MTEYRRWIVECVDKMSEDEPKRIGTFATMNMAVNAIKTEIEKTTEKLDIPHDNGNGEIVYDVLFDDGNRDTASYIIRGDGPL